MDKRSLSAYAGRIKMNMNLIKEDESFCIFDDEILEKSLLLLNACIDEIDRTTNKNTLKFLSNFIEDIFTRFIYCSNLDSESRVSHINNLYSDKERLLVS